MFDTTTPTFLDMIAVGDILGIPEAEALALVERRELRAFRRNNQFVTRPQDVGDYLRRVRATALLITTRN